MIHKPCIHKAHAHDETKEKKKTQIETMGLDISRLTTVVMPNHIGFAQIYSKGIESVAKALLDSNEHDGISHSTDGNLMWKSTFLKIWPLFFPKSLKQANVIVMLWILAMYTYILSFMQIQQFQS